MLEGKQLVFIPFIEQGRFYNVSSNITSSPYLSLHVERYTEIERENRILLEKMTNILQNPKGISHANAHISTIANPINDQ